MERRLFLAMTLSIFVLWIWSMGQPKPTTSLENSEISQESVNKGFMNDESPLVHSGVDSNGIGDFEKKSVQDEKVERIDSDIFDVDVSLLGGSLKKIYLKEYDVYLPITGMESMVGYSNAPFVVEAKEENKISLSYSDNDIKVEKIFEVPEEDYIIKSKIRIYNRKRDQKGLTLSTRSFKISMSSLDNGVNKIDNHEKSLNEYIVYSYDNEIRKSGAYKFSNKEKRDGSGSVLWSGFRTRYFCSIVKPLYETNGYFLNPQGEDEMEVGIIAKEVKISGEGNVQFESVIYFGPEKLDVLKEYGYGFEKIKKYYRFGLFDGIAKLIDSLMRSIYKFIPNWGVCIILISIIIYFSMYPLTLKGMLSMKKMQSLQPKILQLKEKYKDNPQRMNKEMMELYKENKVNPFGGCLPMLLQMPVFIGLYQVLWRSVSFKGSEFLWIKDLSEPDRIFILPFSLPFLGNEINLLPIVMIVVMFFQQKLTAQNMVITDPNQEMQQKMMTIIMPVILGVIFYKFASGLTLYFTMFYLFSTFSQWKMSRQGQKS